MARARSRFPKKIDNLRWDGWNLSALSFGAGQSASVFRSAGTLPETLMRLRGNFLGYLDGTQAPGALVLISVGIILVPEATGSTVLWSPVADDNAPWLWYTSFHLGYEEYVTDVIDAVGAPVYRETIDNKAMRRIRSDVEVQIVFENTTIGSAASVNLVTSGRLLQGF